MPQLEEIPITGPRQARITPGWALVSDAHYIDPSKAPLNPTFGTRGKRSTRLDTTVQSGDQINARQQTVLNTYLKFLDSESTWDKKEVAMVISKKTGAEAKIQTVGVRKILGSGKTLHSHLEDEEALLRQQAAQGGSSTSLEGPQVALSYAIPQRQTSKKRKSDALSATQAHTSGSAHQRAPVNEASKATEFDTNPLLAISPPVLPTHEELANLITAPPLSYNAARAGPPGPDAPKRRHFCDICGYWGQIKCIKCGTRVCSWVHKEEHDANCSP